MSDELKWDTQLHKHALRTQFTHMNWCQHYTCPNPGSFTVL